MENPSDKIGDNSIVLKVSKFPYETESVMLHDIRMNKPFGVVSRKDKVITFLQRTIDFSLGGKAASLVAPNQIALCLSSYRRSQTKAMKIWSMIAEKLKENNIFSGVNVKPVYDFIEQMEIAIVSLYRAIETFANLSIPEHFQYVRSKAPGVMETFTKEGIERRISTSEKIREILPKVLNVESPTKEDFWQGFLEFEELRNEIVHPKTGNFEKMVMKLFQNRCLEINDDAVKLIEYFVIKEPSNRLFPLGFSKSEIPIIETEDISKKNENLNSDT